MSLKRFCKATVAGGCLVFIAASAVAGSYSIGAGDLLSVYVYRQEDMSVKVRVDENGSIRFPLTGRIRAVGKTPDQIESTIAAALRRNGFASPEVVVSVEQFAPRSVFVQGAVEEAKNLEIPLGGELTATQAVSAAGGFKEEADLDAAVVRRVTGGKVETLRVPAREILNGKSVADVFLKPSDSVIVPRAKPVAVLGTVKKPGQFFATAEMPLTVSRVIALAGGVERPNSLSKIRVTRGKESHAVDIYDLLEKGSGGKDMTLEPGDVVYVPETRW